MNDIIKKIEDAQLKESVADFNVGDTVRVSAKIKEGNRERVQVFEGTVLKRQGGSSRETFTVRKLAAVDWFNEQYESRKEEWDAAKHTDWSSLRK